MFMHLLVNLSDEERWDIHLQVQLALDVYARNNLTLEWFSVPHDSDCFYDITPSCKDDFEP